MPEPPCPRCGSTAIRAGVRQAELPFSEVCTGVDSSVAVGVIDMGWRCDSCDHRFGFERLTDEWIAAGGRLTNEQPPRAQAA